MNVNKIILLVGESGSGKTAIAEKANELFGLKSIWSYTNRPKRHNNEKGHMFFNDIQFRNVMSLYDKEIVAYTKFNGYEYFATNDQVEKNNIYVIDCDGFTIFKEKYKGSKQPLIIYIKSPLEIRKERMKQRGDSEDEIKERIENDKIKFENAELMADIVLENNTDTDLNTLARKIWVEFIK